MKKKILLCLLFIILSIIVYKKYDRYIHKNERTCENYIAPSLATDLLCPTCDLKIPKIIHRMWFNFDTQNPTPPPHWLEFDKIFQKNQPGWKVIYWNEQTGRDFMKKYYPEFLSLYDNYDVPIKRADALRFFILDHFGGLYIDYGFYSIKNIDDLLKGSDVVLSEETEICHYIINGFMASIPHHPLWKYIISQLDEYKDLFVLNATGPRFLAKTLNEYQVLNNDNSIKVLHHKYLAPFSWHDNKNAENNPCVADIEKCPTIYPEAYMVTFWKSSWLKLYKK